MRQKFREVDGVGMKMDDKTYLRYLRARNYDFDKASKMFQATLDWRSKVNIKEMHTTWRPTITLENSTGKSYVRGFDKEGHVIVILRPSMENTKEHVGNIKHLIYTMERAVAVLDANDQEKMSLLIDYEGYSLWNAPPMKTSRETLSILQDHYPERLFRAYCIRPPSIFYGFYKLIKPFIDPVTIKKICMLSDKDMSKPDNQLYQEIDRQAVLEVNFGGEDRRVFDSSLYLTPEYFNMDFLSILQLKEKEKYVNQVTQQMQKVVVSVGENLITTPTTSTASDASMAAATTAKEEGDGGGATTTASSSADMA